MEELVQIIHNKPGYVLVQFVYLNLLPQVINSATYLGMEQVNK
mgnify:CR=1 FL=1